MRLHRPVAVALPSWRQGVCPRRLALFVEAEVLEELETPTVS